MQHVVDVFALLPIEHVHHAGGNIGGGERIVELESGGHAGALAGFVVHFVGVVERDNGFFAAQKRPVDGADIGHAANGEAGKACVVRQRGFDGERVNRRFHDIHGAGGGEAARARCPIKAVFFALALGFHAAVGFGVDIAQIHGHAFAVGVVNHKGRRRAAVAGLAGFELGRCPIVKADGAPLDGGLHHGGADAA